MKFRIAPLLCLLSSIAFVNSPVCGMNDEGAKKPLIIQKARFKYPTTDAEIPINHIAITYRALRDKGNDASDKELVAYLLGKTWEQLTEIDQREVVADVVSKVKEIRFEELMHQSSVLEKYRAVRAKNSESDPVLIEYLYGPSWVKLDDEGQKEIVTRVTSKAKIIRFEELMHESKILEKYRAVRATNSAPDLELVSYLYGMEGWALFSPEDQAPFVHLVVNKSRMMDEDGLAELIRTGRLLKAYRALKTRGETSSDEECVKIALRRIAFTGWGRLTPDLKSRAVTIVKQKFLQELKRFSQFRLQLRQIPKTLGESLPLFAREMIRDGVELPADQVLQMVLAVHGYEEMWDKLDETVQEYLVDCVLGKASIGAYTALKEVNVNGRVFLLTENIVPPDGDCGYVAMGFEGREAGIQFLLPHIHRPEVRELIATEIYDMLSQLPPTNPVVTNEHAQRLFEQQHITDFAYQRICQELNDKLGIEEGFRVNGERLFEMCSLSIDPLIQPLHQALSDIHKRMAELELEKLNYCKQEDTIKSYIKTFMQVPAKIYYARHGDPNWLNFSPILSADGKYRTYAIHALAFLQNKNLIIVDDNGRIKHAYKYNNGLEFLPENTTFLLHTDDFGWGCTHFNKLIPLDTFVTPPL